LCHRQYLYPSTALELNIFAVRTQLCVDKSIYSYVAVVSINIESVSMEILQFILVSIVVDVRTSSLSKQSDAILFCESNFMANFCRRQQENVFTPKVPDIFVRF